MTTIEYCLLAAAVVAGVTVLVSSDSFQLWLNGMLSYLM